MEQDGLENEVRSFEELIQAFRRIAPLLDTKIDRIVQNSPDLTGADGRVNVGRLVGMAIIDFIGFAFDRPDMGYQPPGVLD